MGEQSTSPSAVTLLSYRRGRRWRDWKLALVPLAILIAILVAMQSGYVRNARAWFWQHQCMQFAFPPNALICDYDPNWFQGIPPTLVAPINVPNCWQHLESSIVSRSKAGLLIDYWNDQANILSPVPAFVHSRTSPSGHVRLIVVQLAEQMTGGNEYDALLGRVIEPGNLLHPARCTRESSVYVDLGVRIRLFAGSPDAKDPSHFTLNGERNGWRIVIDGLLQDDDTIRWCVTGGGY